MPATFSKRRTYKKKKLSRKPRFTSYSSKFKKNFESNQVGKKLYPKLHKGIMPIGVPLYDPTYPTRGMALTDSLPGGNQYKFQLVYVIEHNGLANDQFAYQVPQTLDVATVHYNSSTISKSPYNYGSTLPVSKDIVNIPGVGNSIGNPELIEASFHENYFTEAISGTWDYASTEIIAQYSSFQDVQMTSLNPQTTMNLSQVKCYTAYSDSIFQTAGIPNNGLYYPDVKAVLQNVKELKPGQKFYHKNSATSISYTNPILHPTPLALYDNTNLAASSKGFSYFIFEFIVSNLHLTTNVISAFPFNFGNLNYIKHCRRSSGLSIDQVPAANIINKTAMEIESMKRLTLLKEQYTLNNDFDKFNLIT